VTDASEAVQPSRRRQRGVGVSIVVAGLVAFVAGGVYFIGSGLHSRSLTHPIAGGLETRGTVVEVYQGGGDGTSAGPVVGFTDASGQRVAFDAPIGSHVPVIGQVAVVSYDPRNPAHAHDLSDTASGWKLLLWVGVAAIVGGFAWTALLGRVMLRACRSSAAAAV
jgi:hypothetical protein